MSSCLSHLNATILLVAVAAAAGAQNGRPADAVEAFNPGTGAGFGQAFLPGNVLSGPDAGANPPSEPSISEAELLTLGSGGNITLRWDDDVILDGPGIDFVVFENVFLTAGTGAPFMEAGVVSVGKTSSTLVTFPFRFEPPTGWDPDNPFAIPLGAENLPGLAGTLPTLQSGVAPFNPATSGGNGFDLADVGLEWVRFVRIEDPRTPGEPGALTGTNGLPIYDTSFGPNGFDLDTIVAVNFGALPAAASGGWQLYE